MFWRQNQKQTSVQRIQTITAEELHQLINSGEPPLLVDVRSAEEYKQDGHIPGARLLPLPLLPLRRSEIPLDLPVVMVCRSGARSSSACEHLVNNGYTQIYNLVGGMMAWDKAGYAKN